MRRRPLHLFLGLIASMAVTLVLVAGPITAQEPAPEPIAVVPNVAGKPSELRLDITGEALGDQSEVPDSVSLRTYRGFRLDTRSVAVACSEQQGQEYRCPRASRIGEGRAQGTANGAIVPGGSASFEAQIDIFLAPAKRRGDIAGIEVQIFEPQSQYRTRARGRLIPISTGRFGSQLLFEDIAGQQTPAPAGLTVKVDRLRARVGATRLATITRTERRRVRTRRGFVIRHVRVTRRVRFNLITNPRTCLSAGWPYQIRTEYQQRADDVRDGTLSCRSR